MDEKVKTALTIERLENELATYIENGMDASSQPFEQARQQLNEAYMFYDQLVLEQAHNEHVENK